MTKGETLMRKMIIPCVVAAMAAGLAGCVGTSALRISSVPDGAKLYANGKYVGETPASVPVDWGYFVVYGHCDMTQIRLEKPGYQAAERKVTRLELGHRNRNGAYLRGSEFGRGRTYPYVFALQPAK
jgi:hypothetical protein